MSSTALLSTAYFPNLQYASKLLSYTKVLIEANENYQKQSYRNRCIILGANGPQALVVPVITKSGKKTNIKDVQIDYSKNWQQVHWRSITSAYNSSPFFEYYMDDLRPFFHSQNHSFLWDLNQYILEFIRNALDLETTIEETQEFLANPSFYKDYRYSIHPKRRMQRKDKEFKVESYTQVFHEKFGFTKNLSVLDLFCNEGPNSRNILQGSIQT